ncbi:MAG: 50S ribosomal protein L9 [Candidatus Margulisbacteria bacterium]|jgi:large subunit ribosomal protein L9|nr:50S ribosomal protein L9 [Candidatus Margulisiibacteriota bacterium]
MEVILLQDTEYGDKGAVVKVAAGHARNFLFPRGAAMPKNAANLRHIAAITAQRQKKLAKEKAEVEALRDKINQAAALVLKAKGGENGQLFGAITHQQIADALNASLGIQIDRRRLGLKSIKEAGEYAAPVKLAFGLSATAQIRAEAEIEKKPEPAARRPRKPRKKEEIAAEIEAREKAEIQDPPAGTGAPAQEG